MGFLESFAVGFVGVLGPPDLSRSSNSEGPSEFAPLGSEVGK